MFPYASPRSRMMARLHDDFIELQDENDRNVRRIKRRNRKLARRNARIQTLEETVNILENTVSMLEADLDATDLVVNGLQTEVTRYKAQLDELSVSCGKLECENEEACDRMEDLNAQLQIAREDRKFYYECAGELADELESLRCDNLKLEDAIGNLEIENAKLANTLFPACTSDCELESDSESDLESESASESDTESESDLESESTSKSDSESESGLESDSASESGTEYTTDFDSDSADDLKQIEIEENESVDMDEDEVVHMVLL